MNRQVWSGLAVGCVIAFGLAPISEAQTLLNRLEQRLNEVLPPGTLPPIAPVVRAFAEAPPGELGLVVDDAAGRVTIAKLRSGSAADRAGLKVGDELLAVNGRIVESAGEFAAAVEPFPAGARLTLEFRRAGQRQRIAVVLAARAPAPAAAPRERQAAVFLVERPTLGVRVGAVTDDARRVYGLTTKRGALIAEIVAGGSLDRAGIGLGAVIVAADGRRIDSPHDLSELVRDLRVGQEIELTYYEGEQLRRKRVRVGTTQEAGPADEAEPLPPVPGEPRPDRGAALQRLERALEGLPKPGVAPEAPEEVAPPNVGEGDLRAEIAELRAELVIVRRRLAELERRLEIRKPRPANVDPDDPDDDRPRLTEPDRPRPAVEPKLQLGEPKLQAPANDPAPKPADAP